MVTEFHMPAYKLANLLKREFKARVMIVSGAGPVNIDKETGMPIRICFITPMQAVAAGLGNFSRHNLVLHPEMGSKMVFTAIITDLDIQGGTPFREVMHRLWCMCRSVLSPCSGPRK
jgi:epoxyqueuosine reductase